MYDLVPGDVIRHRKFGEGTVVSVEPEEGDSSDTLAVVDFASVGRKRLSLMYATTFERVGADGRPRRTPRDVLHDLQALGCSFVPLGADDGVVFGEAIPAALMAEVSRCKPQLAALLAGGAA